MKTKKAAIEIQFNWIFALIAGGLILFFFITVISGQKETSEQKLHTELTSQFELIFAGQGVATGTKNQIAIPPVPISFGCNDYSIGDQSRAFGNSIVFSPPKIEDNMMLTATRAWLIPFKVSNFIYLTAPNIKYYFVGFNEELQTLIEEAMPLGETYYEFVDEAGYANLQYERNPFVKFVFNGIAEQPENIPNLPGSFLDLTPDQVRGVNLVPQIRSIADFDGKTAMVFLKKEGNGWSLDDESVSQESFVNIKFEMFLGGVFAGTAELFQCNMRRAFFRLKYVAGVYDTKLQQLQRKPQYNCEEGLNADPCCGTINAQDGFYTQDFAAMSNLIGSDGFLANNARGTELILHETSLKGKNENAMRGSCPTLY